MPFARRHSKCFTRTIAQPAHVIVFSINTENAMEEFVQLFLIPWAIKALVALAIFMIGKWLAARLTALLARGLERAHFDAMLVKFLSNLGYAVMLVAVVLAAVDTLGVNVTSFLAIVGAAGLAVGLALKDSLSNFAAGVMIVIFRPFNLGDAITAGGSSGTVDEIGMFCTLLRTADNQRIIVPNSAIINGTIVNANALGVRRIDLLFAIGHDDDIAKAKELITSVVKSDARVLANPAFAIGVLEHTQYSVNLYVWPWVKAADYGDVRAALLEQVRTTLNKAGMTAPHPAQDVFTRQWEAPKSQGNA
jgi:small conductance mechanosensitive channel